MWSSSKKHSNRDVMQAAFVQNFISRVHDAFALQHPAVIHPFKPRSICFIFRRLQREQKRRQKKLLSLQFHVFQPPLCIVFHFDTASPMTRDWLSLLLHAQFSAQ